MELIQALFTSEASLTFLDLLPLAAERTAQTLHCLPDFDISLISYDCLILSFHWFVSAGYIYIYIYIYIFAELDIYIYIYMYIFYLANSPFEPAKCAIMPDKVKLIVEFVKSNSGVTCKVQVFCSD